VGDAVPNGATVLGVRPEDLIADLSGVNREENAPPVGDATMNGRHLGTVTLDVVEHMGHETIAHFALAGGEHMARLPANSRVQPGDRLVLNIRQDAHHLFSGDDGRRLN
jgi:ABC-type sugar transport system ATPase subunit